MDERTPPRGQGFTLLIFGGLVALCSVFFILGMVVGRGQGAGAVAGGGEPVAAAQPVAEEGEEDLELDFYEAVAEDEPAVAAGPPPVGESPEPPPLEPAEAPAPPDFGDQAIMLQLGAFGSEATAESIVAEVRTKGFPAIVLRPASDGPTPLYRVQVGPYPSLDEAERMQARLRAGGYEVIPVR